MRRLRSWLNWRVCPTCPREDRTIWRDGNPACWTCDLIPPRPLQEAIAETQANIRAAFAISPALDPLDAVIDDILTTGGKNVVLTRDPSPAAKEPTVELVEALKKLRVIIARNIPDAMSATKDEIEALDIIDAAIERALIKTGFTHPPAQELVEALKEAAFTMRNAKGTIASVQFSDKEVTKSARRKLLAMLALGLAKIDAALAGVK